MKDRDLEAVYWPLRVTYGAIPFLAGLDKFFGLLADWPNYVSQFVAHLLPLPVAQFMMVVGVVEMVVGLAVMTRFTRLGAYVAMGWLVAIALNLVLAGYLDVAVRDLALAVGAYSLGRLAEARGEAWVPASDAAGRRSAAGQTG